MTTTVLTAADTADITLKAKHRAMWAAGDYAKVATDLVWRLGPELVGAAGVRPGQRVLDVAAGSGNAAIPAALAGAVVVASDLTPELFEAGRHAAARAGAVLTWERADAEALPYDDASFDTVLSCLGVMFAPHHQQSADELVRVCRPGGTIGLLSWTPDGFIGRMFSTMRPYAVPPAPGAQPAPLWGDEQHVRALLGDRVTHVTAVERSVTFGGLATGAELRDYFKAYYGPTVSTYNVNLDDPARVRELDAELAALADEALVAGGGRIVSEYLVLTARRR